LKANGRVSPRASGAVSIKAIHQDINAAEHMNALGYIFADQKQSSRVRAALVSWMDLIDEKAATQGSTVSARSLN
jgi:hypothetical protein